MGKGGCLQHPQIQSSSLHVPYERHCIFGLCWYFVHIPDYSMDTLFNVFNQDVLIKYYLTKPLLEKKIPQRFLCFPPSVWDHNISLGITLRAMRELMQNILKQYRWWQHINKNIFKKKIFAQGHIPVNTSYENQKFNSLLIYMA